MRFMRIGERGRTPAVLDAAGVARDLSRSSCPAFGPTPSPGCGCSGRHRPSRTLPELATRGPVGIGAPSRGAQHLVARAELFRPRAEAGWPCRPSRSSFRQPGSTLCGRTGTRS